jgi:hypothetical protein
VVTIKAARKVLFAGAMTGLLVGAASFTAIAQDSNAEAVYANLLEQIANVQAATDQKRLYLQTQENQIASLQQQIASVDEVKASVRPLVTKMVAEMEKEIVSDIPFNTAERFARLDRLKEDLANANSPVPSLFRQSMNILDTEVVAGSSVVAYNGQHPKQDRAGTRLAACDADITSLSCDLPKAVKEALPKDATKVEAPSLRENIYDGYYVHFGRMSMIYLQHDSSEGWRWDKDANDWVEMGAGDVLDARRAVRIARGESAPNVVLAPVKVDG